jgi:hypothetical protein
MREVMGAVESATRSNGASEQKIQLVSVANAAYDLSCYQGSKRRNVGVSLVGGALKRAGVYLLREEMSARTGRLSPRARGPSRRPPPLAKTFAPVGPCRRHLGASRSTALPRPPLAPNQPDFLAQAQNYLVPKDRTRWGHHLRLLRWQVDVKLADALREAMLALAESEQLALRMANCRRSPQISARDIEVTTREELDRKALSPTGCCDHRRSAPPVEPGAVFRKKFGLALSLGAVAAGVINGEAAQPNHERHEPAPATLRVHRHGPASIAHRLMAEPRYHYDRLRLSWVR